MLEIKEVGDSIYLDKNLSYGYEIGDVLKMALANSDPIYIELTGHDIDGGMRGVRISWIEIAWFKIKDRTKRMWYSIKRRV